MKKKDFDIHGLISFVLKLLSNEKNQDYSILLSLFDPTDFDVNEIEQLIKCKNFHKPFLNFKTINFLTTIKNNRDSINKHEQKIIQLEKQYNEMKQLLINFQELIKKQIQQLGNDIKSNASYQEEYLKNLENKTKLYQVNICKAIDNYMLEA